MSNAIEANPQKSYAAPKLTVLGDMVELTASGSAKGPENVGAGPGMGMKL